jgi:hypothetical protein
METELQAWNIQQEEPSAQAQHVLQLAQGKGTDSVATFNDGLSTLAPSEAPSDNSDDDMSDGGNSQLSLQSMHSTISQLQTTVQTQQQEYAKRDQRMNEKFDQLSSNVQAILRAISGHSGTGQTTVTLTSTETQSSITNPSMTSNVGPAKSFPPTGKGIAGGEP